MSGTPLNTILSFRSAYSRSRSFKATRSRKGQNKTFWFGRRDTYFRVSFSRMRKMTLERYLNGPNWTNFENRKNTEVARNSVKNRIFWSSKHQNSVIFQNIYLKFYTHIHLTGVFLIFSGVLKIRKMSSIFLKCNFVDYFSKFSKFLKFRKFEIAVW